MLPWGRSSSGVKLPFWSRTHIPPRSLFLIKAGNFHYNDHRVEILKKSIDEVERLVVGLKGTGQLREVVKNISFDFPLNHLTYVDLSLVKKKEMNAEVAVNTVCEFLT